MASERAGVLDSEARERLIGRPAVAALRPLLTIRQVASVLNVSPKTVRRLVGRGFPHVRFGRVLRFDPADVQRWIVARSG